MAIFSLNSRWIALVARKTWMRGRAESRTAAPARSMSAGLQRARPQMIGPSTCRAMAWTASKSPGDAMGKPASMMSTPRSLSACATSSFSARFMLAPGDCSPSRKVVSKIKQAVVGHGKTPVNKKTPRLQRLGAGISETVSHSDGAPKTTPPGEGRRKSRRIRPLPNIMGVCDGCRGKRPSVVCYLCTSRQDAEKLVGDIPACPQLRLRVCMRY